MCVCAVAARQPGYLGRGKGKCFRGKWISSRIQQRHSKQPLPTPDRSCTIRVHVREAEEPRAERREKKQQQKKKGGSGRALETLVFTSVSPANGLIRGEEEVALKVLIFAFIRAWRDLETDGHCNYK